MKNIAIEIKWALIFMAMSLAWMLMEKVAGLHDTHIDKHAMYTNFIALPAILVYVFALLDKRENFYEGYMTYRQGFICGLIITAIVTLLSPLTQYITTVAITPDYFPNAIRYAVAERAMSQAEAENYFSLKHYIVQGLIGAPLMGLMTTAVVAIFTRRSKP
ncbi:MAG: DUF4199 domain-containing protein [Adhaeribacter sp.]